MKLDKDDYFIVAFLIICVSFFVASWARADGNHNYQSTTNISQISNYNVKGVALAISQAQINFDHGTQSWQGAVGFGAFDSRTAISFGVGKRFKDVIINGAVGVEEGAYGGGVGIMFRFN